MGISSIRSKYTPAGANREIQINDNGVLGSSSGFVLNSSGYVGIGVNNPLRGLHLEGDSGIGAIRFKTTGGEWDFAPFWSAFDDGNFSLNRVSGSGNLLIPSGNIGIGEPSPAAPLHVKAGTPSTTNDAFHISDGTYTNIVMRSGNADGEIRLSAAGTLRGRYAAQYAGTRTGHNFSLGTNDITAITIDTSQNVGVGTTTPVSLSNQTSLTIDGTSIGRLDLKAGGAGGGNIYGSGTEFAWAANSGIVSHFYGAASQPMKYTIGSNEVARFTQANGSGGLTLKTNAGNDLISMGPEGSGGFEEKLLLRGYNNGTISFQFAHSVPNFINTGQNFGIGEDAPPSLLTLKGGNILLEHNSTGADDGHGIFFHTTTNGWSEAASHAAIYGKRVDASNGYLRFDTRSGGTTAERMRLGSDGVVYVYGEARTGVTVPSDHKGAVLQLRGNTQWEAGYAPTPQNSDHDGVIEFFTSDTSGVGAAANTGKVAGSIRSTAMDPYGRYSLEIYTTDASGDTTTPVVDSLVGRFYKYGGNYATGTGSGDGAAQFSLFGASDDTGITDSPGSAIYLNNSDSTVNNYTLLNFRSMVSDGTNYPTAQIRGIKTSDNTVGSSWVSGALAFDTVSAGTGSDNPGNAGSFQERMRITNDGSVGIGETNPAYPLHVAQTGDGYAGMFETTSSTDGDTVRLSLRSAVSQGQVELDWWNDSTRTGGGYGMIQTGKSSNSPDFSILAANTGIGTTEPAEKLHVIGNIAVDSNARKIGYLDDATPANTGYMIPYDLSGFLSLHNNFATGGIKFHTGTSNVEKARIDQTGNLLVGKTTADWTSGNGLVLSCLGYMFFTRSSAAAPIFARYNNPSEAGTNYIHFQIASVSRGSIVWTTSSTSYNTTSDYRLKENVVGITDGITRIKSLKPSRFNFIENAERTVDGFVAHEVSDIVPEAISGAKDAVDDEGNPEYQGIDQSKLVPLLTAALQEAIEKIETLEAKVAVLEEISKK